MLWKKSVQFWNDLGLQKKLFAMFLIALLLFMLLVSCILYININDYTRQNTQQEMEKAFQSAKNSIRSKMDRIDNSALLISGNHAIENVLQGKYFSPYDFYYDLKYQFDSTVTALKFICPEINDVNFYMENPSDNLVRSSFRNLDDFAELYPGVPLEDFQSTFWLCSGAKVYLFRKLYDSYSHDLFAIVEISTDSNTLFADLLPRGRMHSYRFLVSDQNGQPLFLRTDCMMDDGQSPLCAREKLPNGWEMSLQQLYFNLPVSSLASNRDILIAFAALAIILIVQRSLLNSIIRRIARLNRYVSDAVDNHFMGEISCADRDEIGNITRNVNSMVRRTRRLINHVYTSQILQKEAEIKMLQAQINPHFLYNTLSILNWNAIRYGDMETSQIIANLSTFYRSALGESSITTTLGEEVDFIQKYISIRKLTCSHEFALQVDVPQALMDFELPRILLQPIVENAIDHGVEALPPGKEGIVRLSAREDGDEIVIQVSDNGPGMSPEQMAAALLPKTHGYGLYNVDERIKLFFEQSHGISLRDNDPSGLVVAMRIPQYISLGVPPLTGSPV